MTIPSEFRRKIDEARTQNPDAFVQQTTPPALRDPTKKEQEFFASLSPSAKISEGRRLLSEAPLPQFRDTPIAAAAPAQPEVVEPQLTNQSSDEDILASLPGSVLMDTSRTLAQIATEERAKLLVVRKQPTPEQLEQLLDLPPAERIAQARMLGFG